MNIQNGGIKYHKMEFLCLSKYSSKLKAECRAELPVPYSSSIPLAGYFTQGNVYTSMLLSFCSPCAHKSILYVCTSISAPKYVHQYIFLKKEWMYVTHMAYSQCCSPETNPTLQNNYIFIKTNEGRVKIFP